MVVIGRIINQRIRKKNNDTNGDQYPILDDANCSEDDDGKIVENRTLAAQENTRNSPTFLDGQESISVITINPNNLKVERSSLSDSQVQNFPEEVQEYEQILSSLQTGAPQDSIDENHNDTTSSQGINSSVSAHHGGGINKWAWKQFAQTFRDSCD